MQICSPVQTAALQGPANSDVAVAASTLPLLQFLQHAVAHKERLGILRQQRLACAKRVLELAALRLHEPGNSAQQSAFSAAVAADNRVDAAAVHA